MGEPAKTKSIKMDFMTNKITTPAKIKFLRTAFLLLISMAACQSQPNSNNSAKVELPKNIGSFPLKADWSRVFDDDLEAMALDSNILITGTINGKSATIQAFDAASGSNLWEHQFSTEGIGSIAMTDEAIYVIAPPDLIAIDTASGNLIFENDIQVSGIDEISAISDKHVFVAKVSQGVYAYDKFTGKPSWHILFGRGHVDISPGFAYGLVYIIHGEYLMAVNEKDGSLAWQEKIGYQKVVEYYDGFVYYSNSKTKNGSENYLQSLNLETKKALWNSELSEEIKCIKATSGSVIVVTNQAISKFDRLTGDKIWGYYMSPDIYCPPVVLDDVIYLKDGVANQVIAIKQENGEILGRLDFGDLNWFSYEIPKDNLLSSTDPFSKLAFYLKRSVYIYR